MAAASSRNSKTQLREQARAQAQALREQQERAERRRKITRRSLIGGAAVAVVGGVGGLVYWDRSTTGKSVPSQADAAGALSFGKGMKVGTSNSGAKVLDLYFDYSCSHCAEFEALHGEEIKKLVEDGTVNFMLHPCKILGSGWTDVAINTMGVVLDESPEHAYDFHNAILNLFLKAVKAQDQSLLKTQGLKSAAEALGVSASVTKKFDNAVTKNQYAAWTSAGTKAFFDKGFKGTPVVTYDGTVLELGKIASPTGLTDAIKAAGGADSTPAATPSAAEAVTPEASPEATSEATSEATPESTPGQ
ncbi:Protein-disulfide isomerase [Actinomyces bovis]|uniref:Protein-disulfide isomerase n=1 Tax=Actinomyces bovis TaxID=1658 RepID=A0ABY1VNF6_9ACTO|nr:thioredoxin domain-containing protein [Actinomyces bovis]SPT53640.1 Protein-disulfide isomerase [Actinomyces bovis]VEG55710.1 Protein-disulfide isomerase [Actinomyces israelii]